MNLLDQVRQAAASNTLKDQTAEQPERADYQPPAAGRAFARFVSYVELGKRKQRPFQGKEKPPAHEVRLGFELVGKKHAREIEVDGETKTVYPVIYTKVTIKSGDRASFTKLLKAMSYGRDGINHMALLLGEGFIVTVIHNVVGEGADARTYANIKDSEGVWKIAAPLVPKDPGDPECNEMIPAAVPAATVPIQLLLWDSPTIEQWNSIFIDGTREVKDAKGVVQTVSKNWLQEDIQSNAIDFEGSALQAVLADFNTRDTKPAKATPKKEKTSGVSDPLTADPVEATPDTGAAKKAAPAPAPAPSEGDPLADLGFGDL